MTNWKPQTYRNSKYMRFIRELPCCVCGRVPSDPHHFKEKGKGGMGLKSSDLQCIPLCREHHQAGESPGMSWKAFQEKYQIDFNSVRFLCLEQYIQRLQPMGLDKEMNCKHPQKKIVDGYNYDFEVYYECHDCGAGWRQEPDDSDLEEATKISDERDEIDRNNLLLR